MPLSQFSIILKVLVCLSAFIIISENHQFNPNQLTLQLSYDDDDDDDKATNKKKISSGQVLSILRISCLIVHTTFLPTISLLALSFATVNLNASLIIGWLGSVLLVYYNSSNATLINYGCQVVPQEAWHALMHKEKNQMGKAHNHESTVMVSSN